MTIVGTVASIHRFPMKSMQGEQLTEVEDIFVATPWYGAPPIPQRSATIRAARPSISSPPKPAGILSSAICLHCSEI